YSLTRRPTKFCRQKQEGRRTDYTCNIPKNFMSYKSVILLLCLSATALWLCGCGGSPQAVPASSSGTVSPAPPPSASNSAPPANPASGTVFGNLQDSPGWTSC